MTPGAEEATYVVGAISGRGRTAHLVKPGGPVGSLTNWTVSAESLCGVTVYPRGSIHGERNWSCEKCRKRAGWGPNRTLQERGEVR